MSNVFYMSRGKDPMYKTWHCSDEHLFLYTLSNGGSIVSGEKVFPIKTGSLVFIPAGTYHYTMPDEPESYLRHKLTLSAEKVESIVKLLKKDGALPRFSDKAIVYSEIPEKEEERVGNIFRELYENPKDEVLLSVSAANLIYLISRYATETTTASDGFISKAIRYINENISSEIDVDRLCNEVSISKYYFCRQFKKHTGSTAMEYILKTRIVLAKGELKEEKLSVSEISEKFGFSSVSYFCRVFKAEEGLSPLKYRKKYVKKD